MSLLGFEPLKPALQGRNLNWLTLARLAPHRGSARLHSQAERCARGASPVPQPLKPSSLLFGEGAALSGFHQNREATVLYGNIVLAVLLGQTGLSHSNWAVKYILSKNLNAWEAQKQVSYLGCSYLCNLMENEDRNYGNFQQFHACLKEYQTK